MTVAKAWKDGYIGNYSIQPPAPPLRGVGADSNNEDGAFDSAERKAKELIDG